jgi:hypothetical protein
MGSFEHGPQSSSTLIQIIEDAVVSAFAPEPGVLAADPFNRAEQFD